MSRSAVPKFWLQVGEDAEDLSLDDHVERRGRLVGDEELRSKHERESDHDPLTHSAGELVRVLAKARRRDPHPPERLQRALAYLAVAETRFVLLERLLEVILDPHERIQPRHRLLEDQPEVRSPQTS